MSHDMMGEMVPLCWASPRWRNISLNTIADAVGGQLRSEVHAEIESRAGKLWLIQGAGRLGSYRCRRKMYFGVGSSMATPVRRRPERYQPDVAVANFGERFPTAVTALDRLAPLMRGELGRPAQMAGDTITVRASFWSGGQPPASLIHKRWHRSRRPRHPTGSIILPACRARTPIWRSTSGPIAAAVTGVILSAYLISVSAL
jgi:hypothetical protein